MSQRISPAVFAAIIVVVVVIAGAIGYKMLKSDKGTSSAVDPSRIKQSSGGPPSQYMQRMRGSGSGGGMQSGTQGNQ